VDVCLL